MIQTEGVRGKDLRRTDRWSFRRDVLFPPITRDLRHGTNRELFVEAYSFTGGRGRRRRLVRNHGWHHLVWDLIFGEEEEFQSRTECTRELDDDSLFSFLVSV